MISATNPACKTDSVSENNKMSRSTIGAAQTNQPGRWKLSASFSRSASASQAQAAMS